MLKTYQVKFVYHPLFQRLNGAREVDVDIDVETNVN